RNVFYFYPDSITSGRIWKGENPSFGPAPGIVKSVTFFQPYVYDGSHQGRIPGEVDDGVVGKAPCEQRGVLLVDLFHQGWQRLTLKPRHLFPGGLLYGFQYTVEPFLYGFPVHLIFHGRSRSPGTGRIDEGESVIEADPA